MITKSEFLRVIYNSCKELVHENKPTNTLRNSLINYMYAAGGIFDEANVNKNADGGIEYLDDAEMEVAMQKIGDYYEKNIMNKLEEPSANPTNEDYADALVTLGDIDANYDIISKSVARKEEKQEENETSFKQLYNQIKPEIDEVDNAYGQKQPNEANNGYTLDYYIKKLVRVCKNSAKLTNNAKISFLKKAVEIFKEVNTNLTPNYTGKQVLDEKEANSAAEKLTELWNNIAGNEGVEHKDCNGKDDLLYKAMEDETDKDYTNDYCYENIGNGEKVKWTMKTEITSDFTKCNSVQADKDNIAIINGHAVKQK